MKKFTKLLFALLAIVMLISAASCGKTELPEKQILENVYKTENFALPEGMEYVNSLYKTDGGYIVYGQLYDEENGYSNRFARLDENLAFIEYFDIELDLADEGDSWMGDIVIAPDGGCYTTVSTNYYDDETDYYESKNYFVKLDSEYNVVSKVLTTELLGLEAGSYAYFSYMTPLDDGSLAFVCDDSLYILDSEMNIKLKKTTEDLNAMYINTITDSPKGLVVIYSDQSYNNTAVILDMNTMSFSEPYSFANVGWGQYYGASGEYDLYYVDDSGLFGYSFDTGEGVELLNYMNSDLNDFYPNQLIAGDDHTFICTTWNYDDAEESRMVITRLSPVPDEEVQPKYIITLGALYLNYNIREQIFKFNRSSDEYRIVLKDYSADIDYSENSEYTYEDAIAKINSDIAAGNVPDLFVCSAELPFDSYASKGLFADLYEYIDAEETLSRDMFEKNILAAYETDGKLYRISPQYSVRGFAGLNRVLGSRTENWNTDAFIELANSLDENQSMFQDMTRDSFMNLFMSSMYDEFIDAGSGKCNFNDGTFASMLEYASTLSETSIFDNMDWNQTDDSFWQDYESALYEGRVALTHMYISGFNDFVSYFNYTFRTDDIALVGYPTASGNPVIVDDSSAIAISSKSKLKDGAWKFVSTLLSPEYQDSFDYGLPVITSSLEKMMDKQVKEAQERKKRDEENQSIGGVDDEFGVMYSSTMEKAVAVDSAVMPEEGNYYLNEEYANQVLEFIRSADMLVRSDSEILEIVNEEAGRFFEGQCSADDAAQAVQSRVSIYVSQNS